MMASLSSSSPGKPLRLKDFLKEDPNSDSCGGAGGIRAAHRRLPDKSVRHLLAVELGDSSTAGGRATQRCRSKDALTKINAVIRAVKMLPFAASPRPSGCGHSCVTPLPKQGGFLSRSFSRKLRRSFGRKRGENAEHRVESTEVRTIVRVKDIVRLRSFGDDGRVVELAEKTGTRSPPSPVRSTHSGSTTSGGGGGGGAWSDTDSAGSDSFSRGSSVSCGELKDVSPNVVEANCCASPRSPYNKPTTAVGGDSLSTKSTCYLEPKAKEGENGGGAEAMGCPCHLEEEKDQLSPVSVMDFPFEEDDDNGEDDGSVGDLDPARPGASPTSFHRSLANLESTKHQLLQKLREFESLAALVLSPVDLDSRFASAEDESEGEAGDQLLEVEQRAFALLRELQSRGGKAIGGGAVDGLLVDFFIERLSCPRRDDGGVGSRMERRRLGRAAEEEEEEKALLRDADDWIVGRRRGEQGRGWEAEVREMEVDGRWRCAHVKEGEEEEEEIAGDLGGRVLGSLVDEFIADLEKGILGGLQRCRRPTPP